MLERGESDPLSSSERKLIHTKLAWPVTQNRQSCAGNAMHIGNCAVFTLEVNPHGGTTRDPNDYISK
jgi:hypothetical protein